MKIIICGAGEVGYSLAKYLSSEDMQVTVIDDDTEKLQKMEYKSPLDVRIEAVETSRRAPSDAG